MVRLLKPLSYYKEKYGTWHYGLNKLYLLMEKQHNRGQEAAGAGCIKMHSPAGSEYVYRERALGSGAISEIFSSINHQIEHARLGDHSAEWVEEEAPFIGEIYMGHLRYSTTGRSGMSYVHPFLRRNNWCSRSLMLCGNFNMTNVDTIFQEVVKSGQHPRIYSDTVILLEQLGAALDKENHRIYRQYRDSLDEPLLTNTIEDNLDITRVLSSTAPAWDGGFVICGATGSGDMFALRDRHGIRPAFYYYDDEIVVLASERPVIQTVLDVARREVNELAPGSALIVDKAGRVKVTDILGEDTNQRCSFERIYFSRGSDADIYRERKQLGANLVPQIMQSIGGDIAHTAFSFIPNTAEVAFIGMVSGFEDELNKVKTTQILNAQTAGTLNEQRLNEIMSQRLRVEKVAIKDIKLRTFITEGDSRNDLAAHVYDVTYGIVENNVDTLVVIDDSIVRGTTLKQSILHMLDRLHPRKIVVVSSSPQVRYPDYYGIDLANLQELAAFRALIDMLLRDGRRADIDRAFEKAVANLEKPAEEEVNAVKDLYALYSYEEISQHIAQMLTPAGIDAKVDILFQTVEGLHQAVPSSPGDWYFSGDYPTPGGTRNVNRGFRDYYLQTFLPSGTEI